MRAERWDAGSSGSVPPPRSGGVPPRRAMDSGRPARSPQRHPLDESYGGQGRQPRPAGAAPRRAAEPAARRAPQARTRPAAADSSRLRGAVAVIGVFVVTLIAAAADSYIGVGLGLISTVALVGSTVVATLLVRRRDLLTLVIAPPLVFVGVALANIALAPSATLSIGTAGTLLVRGFPTMALAAAAALLVALFRLVTRR